MRNATEAINLVAYSWGRGHIGRADSIVLTELEHHANLVPWQLLAQEKDADLEFVPFDPQGRLITESFEVLLRTRPKLVAFTHKSNALGTLLPAKTMVAQAHEAGALVLVDGAQAVPHLAVDMVDIGADFYVFSGHKVLGPTGSGALWARTELLDEMPPFMSGGEMIESVHLRHTTFNEIPHKFEAGTPDIAAAIGLGAAIDYLTDLGMDRVAAHEEALTAYALEMLPREVPGIHIHRPSRCGRPCRHRHLHPAGGARPRRGHASRPGGHRHPRRPPLHAAAPRATGRDGHLPGVLRRLQWSGRSRPPGRRASRRATYLRPCAGDRRHGVIANRRR